MDKYKYLTDDDIEKGQLILDTYVQMDEKSRAALVVYAGCLRDMAAIRGGHDASKTA